ncbi:MAG: bifunctional riboflavin kinase/FAD synthetase [Reyranellaceae bacterium]
MSGIPVFDDWLDVSVPWHGAVVPLGNFDGVHRGHQVLIGQAAGFAKAIEAPVVALTFEPHPRTFFVKDTAPFRLTSSAAKARLLAGYGVQAVLAQRFDPDFAAVAAEDFVDGILVAGLRARHVVCGYDFTFGARRSGNADLLQRMGDDRGFAVTVVPPVMREGEIYSSTRIREALRSGMVREAADLLGHTWEIEGTVEEGDKRGRTIGFPTANIALGEYLRPRFGVYAVRAAVKENGAWVWRDAVANLGRRPTFGKLQENFEVHVLDFDGDLYGRVVRVALVDFIRPEMRFAGLEALKTQIAADLDAAREILRAG